MINDIRKFSEIVIGATFDFPERPNKLRFRKVGKYCWWYVNPEDAPLSMGWPIECRFPNPDNPEYDPDFDVRVTGNYDDWLTWPKTIRFSELHRNQVFRFIFGPYGLKSVQEYKINYCIKKWENSFEVKGKDTNRTGAIGEGHYAWCEWNDVDPFVHPMYWTGGSHYAYMLNSDEGTDKFLPAHWVDGVWTVIESPSTQ